MNHSKSKNINSKVFLIAMGMNLLTACSSPKFNHYPVTPATPIAFLVNQHGPNDSQSSCSDLSDEYKYLGIYGSAIDREFNAKGPIANITSPTYSTSNGVTNTFGNVSLSSTNSTTYGGHNVIIYDVLTLRAMDINKSISIRLSELQNLSKRLGDCPAEKLTSSNAALEEMKRKLDSETKHYEMNESIRMSNKNSRKSVGFAEKITKQLNEDDIKNHVTEYNNISNKRTEYEITLNQHRNWYEKAEKDAAAKRKWFNENTTIKTNK